MGFLPLFSLVCFLGFPFIFPPFFLYCGLFNDKETDTSTRRKKNQSLPQDMENLSFRVTRIQS